MFRFLKLTSIAWSVTWSDLFAEFGAGSGAEGIWGMYDSPGSGISHSEKTLKIIISFWVGSMNSDFVVIYIFCIHL